MTADGDRDDRTPPADERPGGESSIPIDLEIVRDAGEAEPGAAGSAGGPASAPGPDEKARLPIAAEVSALRSEIEALTKEKDVLYERWLRAQADLDNHRKRAEREREEVRRSAVEAVFRDIVSVLDNFDRALAALPADAPQGLVEGVRLIHRQLLDTLAKRGLVRMDRAEGAFDPHTQEAVAAQERSDVPHHHVLEEVQRGYLYNGRVLRPSLVKVSVRPEGGPPEGDARGENEVPAGESA
jgi:molecular chaperone GrpE